MKTLIYFLKLLPLTLTLACGEKGAVKTTETEAVVQSQEQTQAFQVFEVECGMESDGANMVCAPPIDNKLIIDAKVLYEFSYDACIEDVSWFISADLTSIETTVECSAVFELRTINSEWSLSSQSFELEFYYNENNEQLLELELNNEVVYIDIIFTENHLLDLTSVSLVIIDETGEQRVKKLCPGMSCRNKNRIKITGLENAQSILLISPSRSDLSKNKIHKLSKEVAYKVIQRSNAWSSLVGGHFPNSIRLSIHPQDLLSEKFPIKLLPCNESWGTPWHRVPVKSGDSVKLMKAIDIKKMGGVLKTYLNKYIYFELGANV